MSKELKYNRDQVWEQIVKRQEKDKKRKRFFIFFFFGFLLISGISIYQFSNDSDLNIKQESLKELSIDSSSDETGSSLNIGVDDASEKNEGNSDLVNKEGYDQELIQIQDQSKNVNKNYNQNQNEEQGINQEYKTSENETRKLIKKTIDSGSGNVNMSLDLAEETESTSYGSPINVDSDIVKSKKLAIDNVVKNTEEIDIIPYVLADVSELLRPNKSIDYARSPLLLDFFYAKDFQIDSKNKKNLAFSLFAQNTLSRGSDIYNGEEDFVDSRISSESFNFTNSSTIGLEVNVNKNWLIRAGVNLDVISHTYDHLQSDLILRETAVQHDTAIIYNNTVVPGLRNTNTLGGRHIVKNNEVLKFGVLLGLGYKMHFNKWSLRTYVNSQFDFTQKFYGIIKDIEDVHQFEPALINEAYYTNYNSAKISADIILDRHLFSNLDVFVGLRYTLSEMRFSNDLIFTQDYKGIGISIGIKTDL